MPVFETRVNHTPVPERPGLGFEIDRHLLAVPGVNRCKKPAPRQAPDADLARAAAGSRVRGIAGGQPRLGPLESDPFPGGMKQVDALKARREQLVASVAVPIHHQGSVYHGQRVIYKVWRPKVRLAPAGGEVPAKEAVGHFQPGYRGARFIVRGNGARAYQGDDQELEPAVALEVRPAQTMGGRDSGYAAQIPFRIQRSGALRPPNVAARGRVAKREAGSQRHPSRRVSRAEERGEADVFHRRRGH